MTRLVTVLVTLAVPAEADAEDAAALVADAAVCTALEVVSTAGVEGHLPVPGSVVQHRGGRQPCEYWAGGLSGGGRRAAGQSVRDVRRQACPGPRDERRRLAGQGARPTNLSAGHDGWVLLGTQWATLDAACTATGFIYRR